MVNNMNNIKNKIRCFFDGHSFYGEESYDNSYVIDRCVVCGADYSRGYRSGTLPYLRFRLSGWLSMLKWKIIRKTNIILRKLGIKYWDDDVPF